MLQSSHSMRTSNGASLPNFREAVCITDGMRPSNTLRNHALLGRRSLANPSNLFPWANGSSFLFMREFGTEIAMTG